MATLSMVEISDVGICMSTDARRRSSSAPSPPNKNDRKKS